jgi:hypothetical protein
MPAVSLWTVQQDARLRELWAGDLSATQIGMAMGMNKNQIIGRVHRLGLPQRGTRNAFRRLNEPVTDQQKQIIRDLWATATFARITQYTGLGERRIKAVARELDLPERDPALARPKIARFFKKSRGVVSRPAARPSELPRERHTRAASSSRPGAAINSGVLSSAVERLGASPQAENLPGAVDPMQPRRVFSHKQCQYIAGETRGEYRFCDAPCVENLRGGASPFCAEHYALCMISPKKHEAEKKALRIADAIAGRLRYQPKSAWRA